jgi:nicotinate-nucleotide pyrophosphorylase (carboxylating)
VLDLIDRALAEDVGAGDLSSTAVPVTRRARAAGDLTTATAVTRRARPAGDLTTATVVPPGARARARIEQRAPGVAAGLGVAQSVFERIDPHVEWRSHAREGVWREPGSLAELVGDAAAILRAERVALNFLGRLSGVATLTARYVRAVEGTGVRILDTRKTTPGLRALEKEAVRAGGGVSHRSGLHDAILVKENHAALAGGVGEAARRALAAGPEGVMVEVECATLAELGEALDAGVQRLLLDNMGPDELRRAVELADGRAELEASGGITLETVRSVAETGVDFISVGALTHSAPALDVSLILEPL